MWPAFPAPEYYGGSAPPGPFSGRRAYPRPELAARQQGTATGRFPRSLSFARRRRSPAVSQRHRHEYAADLPHGLPGPVKEPSREVPAARRYGGTHRARPLSIRFEPVYGLKDVRRRFLAYSFPPRSPGPPHLAVLARPGFVRAAPTLPGTTRIRLPSASPPCCDKTAAKVSHLHSNNSASLRRVAQPRGAASDP